MTPVPASEPRAFERPLVRALLVATAVVLAVFMLGWVYDVLLTIFAGVLLGNFLHGLAYPIAYRTRRSYRAVVGSLAVLLVALIAVCIWLIGPALTNQLQQLLIEIPAALNLLRRTMDGMPVLRSLLNPGPVGPLVGAAANALRIGFEGLAGVVIAIVIGIYGAVRSGRILNAPSCDWSLDAAAIGHARCSSA